MSIEELKETTARELPGGRRHRHHGFAPTGAHDLSVSGAGNLDCQCGRQRHRRAFAQAGDATVNGDQPLGLQQRRGNGWRKLGAPRGATA